MPKMKTHRGAAKRFKVTGTGKLRRRQAFMNAILEQAQGYYGNKSRSFRAANEQVMHSLQYAYRDRRARKGDMRRLWIQRINAAARIYGMSYSQLMASLRESGVTLNRKSLAELAARDLPA